VVVPKHAEMALGVGFSLALLYVNARSVASFGSFEYWFAMIKVIAIAVVHHLRAGAGNRARSNPGHRFFEPHGARRFLATGWRGVGWPWSS